jgi:glucosamine--fructose-6-phosphate aminotransferase (isomerizing)
MCGIVGYVGPRQCTTLLLDGLRRLEYRGYDSAGMAVLNASTKLAVRRALGKLGNLEGLLAAEPLEGRVGMGHTRWATHGRPSETNAHPHQAGPVAVVHNGIIENHRELRARLLAEGCVLRSETDTELVAHLIERHLTGAARAAKPGAASAAAPSMQPPPPRGLLESVTAALAEVEGAYSLVVISETDPEALVVAKTSSPLVIGLGQGETFVASDVPAILEHTRDVIFLEDGDVAEIRAGGAKIQSLKGEPRERPVRRITWTPAAAEKGGYKHFMLKEIYEQPRALGDTLAGRVSVARAAVDLDEVPDHVLAGLGPKGGGRVIIVACGTSWHAALCGKFLIEGMARIATEVDLASEFRYRDPVIAPNDLVVAVSQSGETLDTLSAVREAKTRGARVLAIVNVQGSAIAREADGIIATHAGPEIGVASTKAFTTQLCALELLAVALGRAAGTLDEAGAAAVLDGLVHLPHRVQETVEMVAGPVVKVARALLHARDVLYLGRGLQYPIALEGALKLKEISYIHAEGYAAGEMKHGPIALIDEDLPVVVLAPKGPRYEKVLSNLEEVRARRGRVILVGSASDHHLDEMGEFVLRVPDVAPALQPVLTVIPLQLLAYHVADLKGTDVDQPRNLAKSVTVE